MQAEDYGYCECGCGQKTDLCDRTVRSIGWVKGEPKRFVHGHQSRQPGPKYRIDEQTGCWVWLRAKDRKGYGYLRHGPGTMKKAHRVYYTLANGPIPEGLQLDHLCRNPSCVNPAHLEPVTNTENQRRGRKPKLTIEQAREIRSRPTGYGTTKALAAEFGVDPSTIHRIRTGSSWIDADAA